jgi:hypothetical protein
MMTPLRLALKKLVRSFYDVQDQRLRMEKRLGLKKKGKEETKDHDLMMQADEAGLAKLTEHYEAILVVENDMEHSLEDMLERFPFAVELRGVKGIKVKLTSCILAETDIEIAIHASNLTQFYGMNPDFVRGMKNIKKAVYKPGDGEIIRECRDKQNRIYYMVRTYEMVRGDRLTKGFLCPYNQFMKSKLLGSLADQFWSKGNPMRIHYDARRQRRDAQGWGKSDGHRCNDARRICVKTWVQTWLYPTWRAFEGLSVRAPYQEEYLGHTHHSDDLVDID